METRQRVNDADVFLAAVRKEHARFVEALGQAGALLGRGSPQLEHACAAQVQLTRQFLDAQRSILQLRAETDKELALIGAVPGNHAEADGAPHSAVVVAQRQQLSAVLDQWWADESELRRSVIDKARHAVQTYLAQLAISTPAADVVLPSTTTRVLADLEVADASDLQALLGELITSLDLASVNRIGVVEAVEAPAARADDLRFVDAAPSESFTEFWAQRESATPSDAPTMPARRWWSLPHAVYPVAAVASALTVAMAWMG